MFSDTEEFLMFTKQMSARIWRGDKKTIPEMEAKFQSDPVDYLVPFASTLYSFRKNPHCRQRLASLRPQLVSRLMNWAPMNGGDEADCLTTYVFWLSENVPLFDAQRSEMQEVVREVCLSVLTKPDDFQSPHTRALIGLTLAKLAHSNGDSDLFKLAVAYVYNERKKVTDPKQQARVYRGLGMLQKLKGNRRGARAWFMRALNVPGVPFAVHFKTLAAWIGFM